MAVVGWDIGGAHLKAARVENGRITAAIQVAAPLRLGLERLAEAFGEAKALIGQADCQAVTMTGELADTFSSRAEGVAGLTTAAVRELAHSRVMIYAGRAGFVAPADAAKHVSDIASANWFASASVVSKAIGSSLFMDIGSTTTDIVPIVNGTIANRGYTDAERLATGELVYTGLVRSVLMATADGRAKTVAASQARLARMVGRDVDDADTPAWIALAQYFAEAQIRAITDAGMLVLSRGQVPPDAPVVAAGIGAGLLHEVARRLSRDCIGFEALIDAAPSVHTPVSSVAPAAAVAILGSMANGDADTVRPRRVLTSA